MAGVMFFKAQVQMLDMTLDPASTHWVFRSDGAGTPTPTAAGDVSVAIQHFYTVAASGGFAFYPKMSYSVNGAAGLQWTAYDITTHLNGSPHGAPINSGTYALSGMGAPTQPMPEGVAAVLSFRRDYGTDVEFIRDPVTHKVIARPRGQDRGRMYLGPLNYTNMELAPTTNRTRFLASFCNGIIAQLNASLTITDSGSNVWKFSHWSKKKASVANVVQIWADDRPDYQRRRTDQSAVKYQFTPTPY